VGVVPIFRDNPNCVPPSVRELVADYAESIVARCLGAYAGPRRTFAHPLGAQPFLLITGIPRFPVDPAELSAGSSTTSGTGSVNNPALRTLLEENPCSQSAFDDIRGQHDLRDAAADASECPGFASEGSHSLVLLAIDDITEPQRVASS